MHKRNTGISRRRTVHRRWLFMRAVLLLLAPAELALAEPPLPNIPTNVYSVLNFGAYGDGISNNASAISNTINAAAVTGGTVEIPANGTLSTYLCGPISLKNNINLQIDGGATLKMLPLAAIQPTPALRILSAPRICTILN